MVGTCRCVEYNRGVAQLTKQSIAYSSNNLLEIRRIPGVLPNWMEAAETAIAYPKQHFLLNKNNLSPNRTHRVRDCESYKERWDEELAQEVTDWEGCGA